MSKPLWALLLFCTAALALWRGAVGGLAFWNYQRLGTCVPGHVEKIEVRSKGSKYALEASYSYKFREKTYEKKMVLPKPFHLNRVSAEKAATRLAGMQWQVYLDSSAPHLSSLDPQFPLKAVLYGLCSVGVFLYFLYLSIHLELLSKAL